MPYLPDRDIPWMIPLNAIDNTTREVVSVEEVIERMADQQEIYEYEVLPLDHDAYREVRAVVARIEEWCLLEEEGFVYETSDKPYALRIIRKPKVDNRISEPLTD